MFEGQSFVERKADDQRYWIVLNKAERARVIELLLPLGWNEYETFEAEFYGELKWTGHGCGHLGTFGGIASVDEIVSVAFSPAETGEDRTPAFGIREVIRRSRLRVKPFKDYAAVAEQKSP